MEDSLNSEAVLCSSMESIEEEYAALFEADGELQDGRMPIWKFGVTCGVISSTAIRNHTGNSTTWTRTNTFFC